MDPYEQYLADIEYDNYLKQAQAEDAQKQQLAQPADPGFSLGPDYNRSIGGNAMRGVMQAPQAAVALAGDAYNFANPYANNGQGGPIDTIANAGAEKTIDTIGSLSAGTAGAMAGAPLGAWVGALGGPLAPITVPLGGIIGGGLGFGAGLMGYDFTKDATSGEVKPTDQYLKALAYNSGQGAVLGGVTEGLGAGTRAVGGLRGKPGAVDAKVANALTTLEPDLATKIDANGTGPQLFNQSLAEMVGSDKLKALERVSPMASLDNYGASEAARSTRVDRQLKYLEGLDQSTATPGDAKAAIQSGLDAQMMQAQSGVDAARVPVQEALNSLPPSIDPVEAGGIGREALLAGKDAMKGAATEKFTAAGTGTVEPNTALSIEASVMPNYFRDVGTQPNADLVSLIGDLKKEGQPTGILGPDGQPIITPPTYNMQDIQAIRSKALKVKGDRKSVAIAEQIAEALKVDVENAVKAGNVTPEEAAAWQSGLDTYHKRGTIYGGAATPTKGVLTADQYGNFKTPESAIPSKYFKSGNKGAAEAIKNYKEGTRNDPAAMDAMHRYAADSFRRYAVPNGEVITSKANQWLRDHASALTEMSDLRRQLADVHTRAQFLNESLGKLKQTQAEIQKGALQYVLKVDPEQVVPAMLSGKDMIRRTKATVQFLKGKDPDALGGLRRGVIEHLKSITFNPAESGGINRSIQDGIPFEGTASNVALTREWKRIKPALEQSGLFTKSQLSGFDILNNDMNSAASIAKAKIKGDSGTAQNTSVLAALKGIMNKEFLKKYPKTQYVVAILEPVLKNLPQAKFEARLQEALLDPRLARDLLNKATEKNFVKSTKQVFQDEFNQAFGDTTPQGALATGLKTSAQYGAETERRQKQVRPVKKLFPRQQQVTARKSFPNPKELLAPPVKGSLKRTSLDLSGLAPETQARISVESAGNPYAVSPKGAEGLSQLMPPTAQEIAAKKGETYMPLRPGMSPEQQAASIDQNVRFGDYYYKQQLSKYKNKTLAWAAYNAGPGRVDDAIALAGTSRDVNKVLANLPNRVQNETLPYVKKIMARLTAKG